MQVSWIDSEYLNNLLRDLGETSPVAVEEVDLAVPLEEPYTPPAGLVEAEGVGTKSRSIELAVEDQASAEVVETAVTAEVSAPEVTEAEVTEAEVTEAEVTEAEVVTGDERDDEVAPAVERIRDRLRAVREHAVAAGLLRRAVAPPSGSLPVGSAFEQVAKVGMESEARPEATVDFKVREGSIAERLEHFAQWTQVHFAASEVLLLDEQGDVLWGPEAKADLVLSVMLAARAATRSSAASALGARLATSLSHQDLGGGKGTLSVFSCATEQGLIIVGIERAAALCESAARELAAALEATVDRQT
jgi:hypothetical protein